VVRVRVAGAGEVNQLPTVAAIMLADGRQEMADRAAYAFFAQTYGNAHLVVLDTGATHLPFYNYPKITYIRMARKSNDTIGSLRNTANEAVRGADILCHWDSDDWSHPRRIAEQVSALAPIHLPEHTIGGVVQPTMQEHEVTGYNDLLFWEQTRKEAWIYKACPQYSPGAALCYWREVWRRKPFERTNSGEDNQFISGLRGVYVSSLTAEPRMVCGVHPGNTCTKILWPVPEWRKAPEWDGYCREVMG
jgi:glycosyltransferase involved in cell wall biosynthesis